MATATELDRFQPTSLTVQKVGFMYCTSTLCTFVYWFVLHIPDMLQGAKLCPDGSQVRSEPKVSWASRSCLSIQHVGTQPQ